MLRGGGVGRWWRGAASLRVTAQALLLPPPHTHHHHYTTHGLTTQAGAEAGACATSSLKVAGVK